MKSEVCKFETFETVQNRYGVHFLFSGYGLFDFFFLVTFHSFSQLKLSTMEGP